MNVCLGFRFIGGRSQSVGPTATNTEGSPKRQIRSGSAVPSAVSAATNSAAKPPQKKTPASTPTIVERRPRPSKIN